VLYQYAELEVHIEDESFTASTEIWLGFKDPVLKSTKITLHCRECDISKVFVNGIEADYLHIDPLQSLDIGGAQDLQYSADTADVAYRSALEITRSGELQISIPNNLVNNVRLPHRLPKHSPPEVKSRYDKLARTYHNLRARYTSQSAARSRSSLRASKMGAADRGAMAQEGLASANDAATNLDKQASDRAKEANQNDGSVRANWASGDAAPAQGSVNGAGTGNENEGATAEDAGEIEPCRLLHVEVLYKIQPKESGFTLGYSFRKSHGTYTC
jgi:hypothetical protein